MMTERSICLTRQIRLKTPHRDEKEIVTFKEDRRTGIVTLR